MYGVCKLSIVPVRLSHSDTSEMVTQLLFGDIIIVLEKNKQWFKIKNIFDNYEGWIDSKQITLISESEYQFLKSNKPLNIGNRALDLDGPNGPFTIFIGSSLPNFKDNKCQIGNDIYQVKASIEFGSMKDIIKLSNYYLNTPYLWGGKSIFGVDCSGFVQNIFRALNIQIPRDASQQVNEGLLIDWKNRQKGDLVFFTTSSERVTHVGMIISDDKIIHAHGHVRIDTNDIKGIYNNESKKYTHLFHSIRRYS